MLRVVVCPVRLFGTKTTKFSIPRAVRKPLARNKPKAASSVVSPDTIPPPPATGPVKHEDTKDGTAFDVGDAVYKIPKFEKLFKQTMLKESVSGKVMKELQKSGLGDIDIPGADVAEFKEAFAKALREYHQTQGRLKLVDKVDAPTKPPPVKSLPPPAPGMSIAELTENLANARALRQRVQAASTEADFDIDDKELRREYALETTSLRSIKHQGKVGRIKSEFDVMTVPKPLREERGESVRQRRISHVVLGHLSQLMGTDPHLEVLSTVVEFTRAYTSRDLRRVSVLWAFLSEGKGQLDPDHVQRVLERNMKTLRYIIAQQVNIKHTPELTFKQDKEGNREQRLEDIMEQLLREDAVKARTKKRRSIKVRS
eukprot:c9487_g1_i2.p1 GENE.c9487_g1_i2~~c9487_g1_i2.p1  ORF type:complete len:371 (+),score=85.90 c9487_g1_i2:29-1141(+)